MNQNHTLTDFEKTENNKTNCNHPFRGGFKLTNSNQIKYDNFKIQQEQNNQPTKPGRFHSEEFKLKQNNFNCTEQQASSVILTQPPIKKILKNDNPNESQNPTSGFQDPKVNNFMLQRTQNQLGEIQKSRQMNNFKNDEENKSKIHRWFATTQKPRPDEFETNEVFFNKKFSFFDGKNTNDNEQCNQNQFNPFLKPNNLHKNQPFHNANTIEKQNDMTDDRIFFLQKVKSIQEHQLKSKYQIKIDSTQIGLNKIVSSKIETENQNGLKSKLIHREMKTPSEDNSVFFFTKLHSNRRQKS